MRPPKPRWCASTSFSSAIATVFFGYERPTDFRLEERYPQLFPTNVRPETLAKDAEIKQQAADGQARAARNSCASLRRSARRTRKTIW